MVLERDKIVSVRGMPWPKKRAKYYSRHSKISHRNNQLFYKPMLRPMISSIFTSILLFVNKLVKSEEKNIRTDKYYFEFPADEDKHYGSKLYIRHRSGNKMT